MFNINLGISLLSYATKKIMEQGCKSNMQFENREITLEEFDQFIREGRCFACYHTDNQIFSIKDKCKGNWKGSNVLFIDIDESKFSPLTFYHLLYTKSKEIKGLTPSQISPTLIYTTSSNKKKCFENGEPIYRFRLVYVLSQFVDNEELYTFVGGKITSQIFETTGIKCDNCSSKISQLFYGNGEECEIFYPQPEGDLNKPPYPNVLEIENILTKKVSLSSTQKQESSILLNSNNLFQDSLSICNIIKKNPHNIVTDIDKKTSSKSLTEREILPQPKSVKRGKSLKIQKVSEEMLKDLKNERDQNFNIWNFFEKWRKKRGYEFFEASELIPCPDKHCSLFPDDYQEIYRKKDWKTGEVKRVKDGEGRRKKLFATAVLRRLMRPRISPTEMLFNLLYDREYYYENWDNQLSIKELVSISEDVCNRPFKSLTKKDVKHPVLRVDKIWCYEHHIKPSVWASKVKKIILDEKIEKYFVREWSVKDNLQFLAKKGVRVSRQKLYNYMKERGITPPPSSKGKTA